jgi:hypothetical protein
MSVHATPRIRPDDVVGGSRENRFGDADRVQFHMLEREPAAGQHDHDGDAGPIRRKNAREAAGEESACRRLRGKAARRMPHHQSADDEKDIDAARADARRRSGHDGQRTAGGFFENVMREHRERGEKAQMLEAVQAGWTPWMSSVSAAMAKGAARIDGTR